MARFFVVKFFCSEAFAKQKKKKRKEKTPWTVLLIQVVATYYVLWCLRAICMYTEKIVRKIYVCIYIHTYTYKQVVPTYYVVFPSWAVVVRCVFFTSSLRVVYTGGADILCGVYELGCAGKRSFVRGPK